MGSRRDEPKFSSELEWITFREEAGLGDYPVEEGTSNKFLRKMKANPFVPIGALATVAALSYGLWCFRQGRAKHSQYMMRARIGAQGFTVVAILAGFFLGADGSSPKG